MVAARCDRFDRARTALPQARPGSGLVLLTALAAHGLLAGQDPVPPPAATVGTTTWTDEVRLHVAADAIVRGVVHVDAAAVGAARQRGAQVDVTIDVQEMVHGAELRTISFRHHVPAQAAAVAGAWPRADDLLALDGEDRVVFLVSVAGRNYLAGGREAIVTPARELLARLKQREVLHRQLLRTPLVLDAARQREVAAILAQVTADAKSQDDGFVALERLGVEAVPEIVAAMDDRRKLPVRSLTLGNRVGGFEAQRHYGPERVVDALAAILNQLTGESFGSLVNGASDAERAAAVRAWTLFAHYRTANVGKVR